MGDQLDDTPSADAVDISKPARPTPRKNALVALVVVAAAIAVLVAFTAGDDDTDGAGSDPGTPGAGAASAADADTEAFCEYAGERAGALSGVEAAAGDRDALRAEIESAISDYERLAALAPADVTPAFEAQARAMHEFDEILESVDYDLENAGDAVILTAMDALSEANTTAPQVNEFLSEACGITLVSGTPGTGSGSPNE